MYKGARKSFINNFKAGNYFGHDGLGDFNFTGRIIATVDESKHAAVALVDLVKQYPGSLNYTYMEYSKKSKLIEEVAIFNHSYWNF